MERIKTNLNLTLNFLLYSHTIAKRKETHYTNLNEKIT
jgi:hypothetical protein